MEIREFEVRVYNNTKKLIEKFTCLAKTEKGVEKIHKNKFKEYRKLEYNWTIE